MPCCLPIENKRIYHYFNPASVCDKDHKNLIGLPAVNFSRLNPKIVNLQNVYQGNRNSLGVSVVCWMGTYC